MWRDGEIIHISSSRLRSIHTCRNMKECRHLMVTVARRVARKTDTSLVSIKFNRCWIHHSVECVECGTFAREMDGTPFTVSTFPLHDKTGKKVLTLWHVAGWNSRTWLHPRLNFWGLFATHDSKYQPPVIAWFHTQPCQILHFCTSDLSYERTRKQNHPTPTYQHGSSTYLPTWLRINTNQC